jgi:hypothetical protein
VYGVLETHFRRLLAFVSRDGMPKIFPLHLMHLCSVVACRRVFLFSRVPSASTLPINEIDEKADDCESTKNYSDANTSFCSGGEVAL